MDGDAFSESVQNYLRNSGYAQKELADKVGLHPKVLSRKFHGTDGAHLTHHEIRRIVLELAEWHVFHTQDEAIRLLKSAGMAATAFNDEEWNSFPLNTLTPSQPRSLLSSTNSSTRRHNLPAPTTRLIGRERVVERLQQLFAREDVRLVTLVGTGGAGKTRLALYMARESISTFAHGVWFIDLSGINDPDQVPLGIAQVLQIKTSVGSSPQQSLLAHVRNKQFLLVLDNFEQVGAAAPLVARILAEAPRIKILVTSRAILHIYGEYEFSVPPLDVPDTGFRLQTTRFLNYGSLQLFVERAQGVQPDFLLTDANVHIIAQICVKVDGLPLALELAAARIKVLPPAILLERLTSARLPMLTGGAKNLPGRQQTLRDTIAWSYNLLTPDEQRRFRQLSIFTGGWSLEAAEMLIDEDSETTLDFLKQLMDQSLLIRQPMAGNQARYTMLATLREYALEQLTAHGELKQIRDWHVSYYLAEVEAAEIGMRGPEQIDWMARLVADHDNIRTALEWSTQKARSSLPIQVTTRRQADPQASQDCGELPALEVCLRLAATYRLYWEWQGELVEGREWLKTVLALPLGPDANRRMLIARAKALSEAARLVFLQNDTEEAIRLVTASITLWRELDDPRGLAIALMHRGWIAHGMGEYETARGVYEEGLRLVAVETDPWLYAQLLVPLASLMGFISEYDLMRTYYARSLALFERLGDKSSCADLLKDQGGLLILEGRYTTSIDYLLQSMKLCQELNHKQFLTTGIGWLSFAVGLSKVPNAAAAAIYSAHIRGAAESLMNEIGMTHWSDTLEFIQVVQEHIRSAVDEQAWENALAEGRTFSIEQTLELVIHLRKQMV